MITQPVWRVPTAVKINLHLGVGRVGDDGFHPVRTVNCVLQVAAAAPCG